ncbi:MAG: hypothetical protein KKA73_04915 [Chloroflexi bacterium]|nr:hypothetical protein [Chloroflexota bacterium]MBU1747008.1 hypothetical protein [Chloroflexota bacterium]
MRVFAYCAQSFAATTRAAAGVAPLTSPPLTGATFDPRWLAGYDLLYLDLHGQPGQPTWWGDEAVALTAAQIQTTDLTGAVVFAVNCHLADADSPMLDALLSAGARYVIGGDGRNWGGERALLGAPLLGQWFRRLLRVHVPPLLALRWAKARVQADLWAADAQERHDLAEAARDTLAFQAYYRRTS